MRIHDVRKLEATVISRYKTKVTENELEHRTLP